MPHLREGWYLMSPADLEAELLRWRVPSAEAPPSNASPLSVDDALAYRNAGNLPDELGRSLRLVLLLDDRSDLGSVAVRRLRYEPDYHEAPHWRRVGSKPVNVVPLTPPSQERSQHPSPRPWWEQPDVAALEEEWRSTGAVAGINVPAEHRGFVYKTVIALRAAGKEISPTTVADSVARWLPPDDARRLRDALLDANRSRYEPPSARE